VYLTDSLSDGKPYDNSDSVVDSDEVAEPPKKPTPKWVYALLIGVVIVIGGFGYINSTNQTENDVLILDQKLECDLLLEEARLLIDKNDNNLDVDQWELEEDTVKIREINQTFSDNCIPTKENVISDLEKCTIVYITIESLIDKMDERKLGSLSQAEQKAYNTNYDDYFNSYCNKIKDEIEQTEKFQNFNKTRG